jgi:hypothetical protein
LTLTDYHFFRSLSNNLRGQEFYKEQGLKVDTVTFFT